MGTFDVRNRKTWQQYADEGIILIGVGGSPYDEHPSPDFGDRKAKGESSMSLVAKDLGISNDPRYREVIKIVTRGDLEGTKVDQIAARVKSIHRQNRGDPMKAINWGLDGLHSIVMDQHELIAARLVARNAQSTKIVCWDKKHKIGMAISDNYMLGMASRELGYSVFVQQNTLGQTNVFSRHKDGPDMSEVAAALRTEESFARNFSISTDVNVHQPGQIEQVPIWCYQMPGESMLNGSERASDVEPTFIPLERIFELVVKYIRFANSVSSAEENHHHLLQRAMPQ